VLVGCDVRIEAHAGEFGALSQKALSGQRAEIPVDRRETHPGKPSLDGPVDDGGRRMGCGRANDCEDGPPRLGEPESPSAEIDGFPSRARLTCAARSPNEPNHARA
jgi:hypothetical protein